MRNFYVLATALDYIEENITTQFTLDDVANACAISLSNLHKLFRYALGYSIKSYIQRRRHSLACKDLINTQMSILQIAIKYQYNSAEVFIRAFTKLRGEPPSSYRRKCSLANLYPKLEFDTGGTDMRKVDISELYDTLKALGKSYVLCADVAGLMVINDQYGHSAGDIVLAKTAERIEKHLTDDMFLFRIGRDEFAIITGFYDEAKAVELEKLILKENGEILSVGENKISLSLHIGITNIPAASLSYQEVLQNMLTTLDVAKGKIR